MQPTILLTAFLATATTTLSAPTKPIEAETESSPYNETPDGVVVIATRLNGTDLTVSSPHDDNQLEHGHRKWDKKKITVEIYSKLGNACIGHWAQSKHHLQPFKCKNFGWTDRFEEVMFELPKQAHEENVYCTLKFYQGDGCEGPQTGILDNSQESPVCAVNEVASLLDKTSCRPECWTH